MNASLLSDVGIFVLAILAGFEVISKVPSTLHTPLMSASNAIHGIVVVGAMLSVSAADNVVGYILGFVAMAFAGMNVVGGFAVTQRMLEMFKRRPTPDQQGSGPAPVDQAAAATVESNGGRG